MKKSLYLNKETYLLAVMFAIRSGGNVRTGDIAKQFGISRVYAYKLLNELHDRNVVSRKVLAYRSNSTVYEYLMLPEHKYFYDRDFAGMAQEAIKQAYGIKHANELLSIEVNHE